MRRRWARRWRRRPRRATHLHRLFTPPLVVQGERSFLWTARDVTFASAHSCRVAGRIRGDTPCPPRTGRPNRHPLAHGSRHCPRWLLWDCRLARSQFGAIFIQSLESSVLVLRRRPPIAGWPFPGLALPLLLSYSTAPGTVQQSDPPLRSTRMPSTGAVRWEPPHVWRPTASQASYSGFSHLVSFVRLL